MTKGPQCVLYCGDNLDILYRYTAGESVDLVYPDDPLFNSNQDYNVLSAEKIGPQAAGAEKDRCSDGQSFL